MPVETRDLNLLYSTWYLLLLLYVISVCVFVWLSWPLVKYVVLKNSTLIGQSLSTHWWIGCLYICHSSCFSFPHIQSKDNCDFTWFCIRDVRWSTLVIFWWDTECKFYSDMALPRMALGTCTWWKWLLVNRTKLSVYPITKINLWISVYTIQIYLYSGFLIYITFILFVCKQHKFKINQIYK